MPKGSFKLVIDELSSIMRVSESSTPDHTVLSQIEGLVIRVSK